MVRRVEPSADARRGPLSTTGSRLGGPLWAIGAAVVFAVLNAAVATGHLTAGAGRRSGVAFQAELTAARLLWVPFALLAARSWSRRRAAGRAGAGRQTKAGGTAEARRRQAARVRRILDAAESLEIEFQPVVSFATGRMDGVEALARFRVQPYWPPDVWFREAESLGMGPDLELCALRLAVAQIAALVDDVYLSVNLSPEVLARPEVIGLLADRPDRVVVEITEHAVVTEYGVLNEHLGRLRRRGVRVAVDDVGAGYATLRHVVRIAPDVIKLDRGLVTALGTDPALPALIGGLAAYARDSGASLVAEGIETADEMHALRALGVTHGQGQHLGAPAPLAGVDQRGDWLSKLGDGRPS